ncbi:hypothetical protein M2140_001353 [Clostridiales Family XIII bacterium PM5-7]
MPSVFSSFEGGDDDGTSEMPSTRNIKGLDGNINVFGGENAIIGLLQGCAHIMV